MKNPELVVMAAGMGSRYGGLKQIDKIDEYGHIIIDYSIHDAIEAGFRDVTFIIKKKIERDFREVMDSHLSGKSINVKYVYQETDRLPDGYSVPEGREKPWGTAHAIACCFGVVDAPFAVINADDYYGKDAFVKMYNFLKNTADDTKYHYAMVGYRVKNTVTEKGTVSRGVCEIDKSGMLSSVVEKTKIGVDGERIYYIEDEKEYELDPNTLVSMNLWGFTPSYIRECRERFSTFLDKSLDKNPLKCEFYLPTVVTELINENLADIKVMESVDRWYGVTYKEDKETVSKAFSDMIASGKYPKDF